MPTFAARLRRLAEQIRATNPERADFLEALATHYNQDRTHVVDEAVRVIDSALTPLEADLEATIAQMKAFEARLTALMDRDRLAAQLDRARIRDESLEDGMAIKAEVRVLAERVASLAERVASLEAQIRQQDPSSALEQGKAVGDEPTATA